VPRRGGAVAAADELASRDLHPCMTLQCPDALGGLGKRRLGLLQPAPRIREQHAENDDRQKGQKIKHPMPFASRLYQPEAERSTAFSSASGDRTMST
jgi:hypothetical protein